MKRNDAPALQGRILQGDKMLSVRETAEVLGCCLDTVRRDLRSGKMPGVKTGHSWRIPSSQLSSYLQSGQNDYSGDTPKLEVVPDINEGDPASNVEGGDEVTDILLRTHSVRLRVLDLTQAALENGAVPPRQSRAALRNLRTLLNQL